MQEQNNDFGILDLFPPRYKSQISHVSITSLAKTYKLAIAGKSKVHNVTVYLHSSAYYPTGTSFVLGKYFDNHIYFPLTQATCALDDPLISTYIVKECDFIFSKTSVFGCCARYEQCSNEKHCVHDNPFYSNGCTYRKNLENGKIFYGVNKNV